MTEQQMITRVQNVIVGAFALVGFVTVFVWLESKLAYWQVNAVLVLCVVAVHLVCAAIRFYLRRRDRRAVCWPSP
jgi:hypothetical protein